MIDSDVLIDASRALEPGLEFLEEQERTGPLVVSVVTAMELVAGCRNMEALRRTRRFLARFQVVPLSAATSLTAYHLMEQFAVSHGLQVADALIAASALDRAETLFTRNVRPFQMIPGLTVHRPY